MSIRSARVVAILALAILLLVVIIRDQPAALAGRWRDQSPAALLYEFRDDGSVWLVRDGRDVPVFRYAVEGDVVEFHDGMGRPRAYHFALDGDRLTLRELAEQGDTVEYRRE